MGSSSFDERNRMETTSTQPGGGCFSAIFSPLIFIFGIMAFLRLATGETTRPWDLIVDFKPRESITITIGSGSDSDKNDPPASPSQTIAPFFAPSVRYWEEDILRWAAEWDLDRRETGLALNNDDEMVALYRTDGTSADHVFVDPMHFELVGPGP